MRVKEDLNGVLRGTWQAELSAAPCQDPLACCCGFWCPCPAAHHQRNKILDLTGEPYVCCGGGCVCCEAPCESREPWLCLETCCCTSPAILANRFMIQTRFDIQNDPCDETILSITACINMLAACAEICMDRESAQHLEHLVHLINACVCSCMIAQQEIQLRATEQAFQAQPYTGPPEYVFVVLPPVQQNMVQAAQALRMSGQPPLATPPAPQGMLAEPLAPAPAPGGLVAHGRQVMITVPQGTSPGQLVVFQTPEGNQSQVAVPQGLTPGQQFLAQY